MTKETYKKLIYFVTTVGMVTALVFAVLAIANSTKKPTSKTEMEIKTEQQLIDAKTETYSITSWYTAVGTLVVFAVLSGIGSVIGNGEKVYSLLYNQNHAKKSDTAYSPYPTLPAKKITHAEVINGKLCTFYSDLKNIKIVSKDERQIAAAKSIRLNARLNFKHVPENNTFEAITLSDYTIGVIEDKDLCDSIIKALQDGMEIIGISENSPCDSITINFYKP